jgi:glutathione peroxidase-family protein
VHGVEDKWEGFVKFTFLNIDDPNTEPFKQQLGFRYQPQIFLLDADGNVIQQWAGAVSGEELEAAIVAALNS